MTDPQAPRSGDGGSPHLVFFFLSRIMLPSLKKRLAQMILSGMMIGMFMFASFALPPSAHAQSTLTDENQCGAKILTFLVSFLSSDNAADYWTDYFKRNRCQQEDIFALQEEIDSLILQLYEADCSVSEFTDLQNEIRERKMELYFVRHIVPAFEDTFFEKDLNALEYEAWADKVSEEMIFLFSNEKGKGWISIDALTTLFKEWKTRYEYRIETYKDCHNSPWQAVGDEFRKLAQTMKDIKDLFSFKNLKETAEPYTEDIKERWEEKGILNANGEFESMGSILSSLLEKNIDLNIQNMPSQKDLDDIIGEHEASGNVLTTGEAQSELQAANLDYGLLADKEDLIARYMLLYQQGNVEITARLTDKIDALDEIVCTSTSGGGGVNLNSLALIAKDIHKKQGKGTP